MVDWYAAAGNTGTLSLAFITLTVMVAVALRLSTVFASLTTTWKKRKSKFLLQSIISQFHWNIIKVLGIYLHLST